MNEGRKEGRKEGMNAVRDAKRSNAERSTGARTRHTHDARAQHVSAQHHSGHDTVHILGKVCTVVPSFFGSSFAVCVYRQLGCSRRIPQLLTAIKGSDFDQPGVLVAYIEGVLEDGTDGGDITGTGIPAAIATDIVSMVPISSPASSSLAASSRSHLLLSSLSLASPSPGALSKPVERSIRSRKGERLQGGKKEWKTGVMEESGGRRKTSALLKQRKM